MKTKKTLALICILLSIGILNISAQEKIRLMSYNVHNGIGLDNKTDYVRIAEIIKTHNPDVVAIQELDSATTRSNRAVVLNEIALNSQMYPTYGAAINFSGGKYGLGILSKEKPLSFRNIPLPGREEARTLLIAEFEDYIFACTHLSLTEEDRDLSLDILNNESKKHSKPFFIAGDFNSQPEEHFMKSFQSCFKLLSSPKHPTYPSDEPNITIDYIAVSSKDTSAVVTTKKEVLKENIASDHRPVLCDVMLKCPSEKIFRMKPYLQNPFNNCITVMWQTTVPAYSWVEYGTDKNNFKKAHTLVDGQVICNDIQHKIRLENLKPGETYYYRVCSKEILVYQAYNKVFGNTAYSEIYSFTMPDEESSDFTALIFNDLHKRSKTFQALYSHVKDTDYDFVVFNGDCVDDPANHNQATDYIKELTETVKSSNIPTFFIRGNHEIRNAYSIGLRSLFDYVNDKTYHAFNWGDTRFIVLDCGEDKPDDHWVYYGLNDFTQLRKDQTEFLKSELKSKANKKAAKRVLLHHIPLYGLDSKYNPCKSAWEDILVKSKIDVSINAHTHRFAYHPKGECGNVYPVIIGGGPGIDDATVILLKKEGDVIILKALNSHGKELLSIEL